MLVDLNEAGEFSFDKTYDVCVAGSGPAGITIARKLGATGASVLLLEAGGLEPTLESFDVYEGASVGPHNDLGVTPCRLRYFGGTSNHWSGLCSRFDPIDFEARDIWGMPGWPIGFRDIYRYEDEAREIVDIADQPFEREDEELWHEPRMQPARLALSPPTRFGEKYKDELEGDANIDIALNANVIDARLNADKRAIRELVVADYAGKQYSVKAKFNVIAFGGMETPRFLLNARNDVATGLGNHSDMVGRCFMEHLNVALGRFVALGAPLWDRPNRIALNPSVDLIRKHNLSSGIIALTPGATPKFYGRLAPVRKVLRNLTCGNDFLLERARRTEDVQCQGDGMTGTLIEQTPNRESRITVDENVGRDQFGLARIKLDWRINDQDRRTIRTLAEETGRALAAQDAGRFQIAHHILDGGDPEIEMHCHHMGTTRMSAAPRDGVVDLNSKVHGVENLYIGGSSVFPTGGGCNPTFTIVCLALRLADHLSARVARG